MEISNIQNFFFDLDKTLWNWEEPVLGAADLIDTIYGNDKNVYFYTDNSLLDREEYVGKLRSMNIPAKPQQVLTPDRVVVKYLKKNGIRSVYAIGSSSFLNALEEQGIDVNQGANHVILGFDRQFSYTKLKRATEIMQDGGEFIVCSTEKTFKKGDKLEPHQLALNNALKTFKQPRNFGKPSDEYINAFTSYFSFLPSRSMLVGDRLEDMEIGNRMGMTTAAVMSGDINRGNLSDARPVQKPDIGVSNLNRLKRKIDGIQFK